MMEALTLWQGALHEAGWLIGWALIHLLWQGALLGIVYAVGRSLLPRGEARYRFGMGMLLVFGLCPLLTVWRLWRHALPSVATTVDLITPGAVVQQTAWKLSSVASLDADRVLPWLVIGWSCGVLLLSLRAWWQWRGLKALLKRAEELAPWQALATTMSRRFGLQRRVRVLCSGNISAPLLLGWVKPVILLPLAMVCHLPAAQVELILAHELAHLRRWDPLANLFQVILETLYFFHPVLHWISRDVRNEREICCDRLALEISGGSRQQMARALAGLCELNERQPPLALAANGGVLLDRVQQLALDKPVRAARQASRLARFAAVMLGVVIATAALAVEWNLALLQRGLMDSLQRLQSTVLPTWSPLLNTFRVSLAHDLVIPHTQAVRIASIPSSAPDVPQTVDPSMALPRPSIRWEIARPPVSDLVSRREPVLNLPALAPQATEAPIALQIRQPAYPEKALEHGVEGSVVLEFGLTPDGTVKNVQVVDAEPAGVFDEAAIDAFLQWKFRVPPQLSEAARFRQNLSFTLHGDGNATGSRNTVHAKTGCYIATGTHICRSPEDLRTPLSGSRR